MVIRTLLLLGTLAGALAVPTPPVAADPETDYQSARYDPGSAGGGDTRRNDDPGAAASRYRPGIDGPTVDRILVMKSERRLYLLRDNEVLKSYPIQLGRSPVGHKVFEGDGRTPEGLYILDDRNTGSRFYRSIRISYPNAQDVAEAGQYGRRAGGLVMIHGQPNYTNGGRHAARSWDWTEGCIAVSNAEMDEIWAATTPGTVIEILP